MHDWSLLSLTIDWKTAGVTVQLESSTGRADLHASGLDEIRVPRKQPWGSSVSINAIEGPTLRVDGLSHLAIEMQSGDLIEIIARSFKMPDAPKRPVNT